MKKRVSLLHPLLVFIVAQIIWLSLLGLWIYFYVTNYLIIKNLNDAVFPEIISERANVLALVLGLVMMVLLLVGIYFVFIYLARQINITQMYDNFVSNVSHELKTPLASIQLYLETLRLRELPWEKQKEFIDMMLADTGRLKKLINSILDISLIEQRKIAYNFQVKDAGALVRELIEQSRAKLRIPAEAIEIKGRANCRIVADSLSLMIVFDNLIDNALKYSDNPLKMEIYINCNSDTFTIEFCDHGIGLSRSDQKKIFKKFQRIHTPNTPDVRGTGLGLYMVREIVKAHRGKIRVSSPGPNLGTTFRIDLPRYDSGSKRPFKRLLKNSKSTESNHEE